jgi:drug/metabolite transporter (DMT)-like permease
MNQKTNRLLAIGLILIVASVGLAWFGFTTDNPNPVPSLGALAGAVLSFIVGGLLISKSVRGMPEVETPALLKKGGNLVFAVGSILTIYAALAFFLLQSLPPNTPASRLPSLYLLFTGMVILLVGAVARNFKLH